MLLLVIKILLTLIPILISIAFYTLLERKILAAIQRRRGPNVVGFWGLLQPLADGLKLGVKEFLIPNRVNRILYILSPLWIFTLSFSTWSIIPFYFNNFFVNLSYGLLCLITFSSLGVYGIIIAGWSSNSSYALFGALRSAAQIISYEISFSLTILPVALWSNSFNFLDIVYSQSIIYNIYFAFPFLPLVIIFFISMLAETNRTPFDLPEAEAELVAGFNVEYSATPFALFFLAEYSSMLIMCATISILFFGGWGICEESQIFINIYFFILKILFFAFLFILVRAGLPRYRYDQLMKICWQIFLPFSFSFFHFTATLLCFADLISWGI